MKFFTAVIGVLAALGTRCTNPCRSWQKDDLMQSGLIQLTNSQTFKDNCFSIPLTLPLPPTKPLKISISTPNLQNFTTKQGIDYAVRARRKPNSNALSVYLFVGNKQWRKVTLSYFVATREDLEMGAFLVDGVAVMGCQGNGGKVEVREQLGQIGTVGRAYNAVAYLSGLRTQKQLPSLKLSSQTFDQKTSTLSLTLQSDTPPETLSISYILYRPQVLQFRTYKPNEQPELDYTLVGLYGFEKGRGIVEGFGVLVDRRVCVGGACSGGCVNRRQCLGLGGFVNEGGCLACGRGERLAEGKCMPLCGTGFVLDKGVCVCAPGYVAVGKNCLPRCPDNETYNDQQKCDCRTGWARLAGTCRECPPNSQLIGSKCLCNPDYKWDQPKLSCLKAPILPPTPPILCPPRSSWNPALLTCQCTVPDEHMISNICSKCPTGQSWNGKACACPTGLYRVEGVCRACDINAGYDGRACVCNWGFFDNGDRCEKCHVTCGRCTGSGANQCTACSDVNLTLKNNYCYRQTNCPPGFYLDTMCKECPSYCSSCSSDTQCTGCIPGFQLAQTKLDDGQAVSYCAEVCGDGRRFEDQCDDGNAVDGDGCSRECKVEKEFTCSGGTTVRKSTCAKISKPRCMVTPTAAAQFGPKIIQGIRLSYVPPELLQNDCQKCFQLLQIKILTSPIVPSMMINFLPKSQYQFWASFDFYGLYAIPIFTISVQINPEFARYFSVEDMAQLEIRTIDPALLAKVEAVDTLSLEDGGVGSQQIQEFVMNAG